VPLTVGIGNRYKFFDFM